VSLRLIQHIVARHYGLTMDELLSRSRVQRLAHPRAVAMTLCRELTDASLPRIGRCCGKDHTTIIHGLRRCAVTPALTEALTRLRPIVQVALALEELDTLPMRVYSAQAQQSRWDEPPPPREPPRKRARDYKREWARTLARRRARIQAVGMEAYRTDQPVPSAWVP
jgi:hypothetical protein